jgi:small conductance mechanosensitive channel
VTPDNKDVIVPNGQIYSGNITNISANDTRRVDLVFGIGYGDDLLKAKKIMQDIIDNHELVLDDPAPAVAIAELADSSVNFHVRPWVKSADWWTVRCDVIEQVKLAFDENGISIPYPQMDVHLNKISE